MTQVVLDPDLFREQFPAFSDASLFPDSWLQIYWNMATCYISDQTNDFLGETCLTLLVNLLTAHLTSIGGTVEDGGNTTLVESATIDDVMVKAAIPDVDDPFVWWILQTPYGSQYYNLLSVKIAGGFYCGGSYDLQAFRGSSGNFNA